MSAVSAPAEAPIRLHLNENPFGPLPSVRAALIESVDDVNRYPEFLPDSLRAVIADHLGCSQSMVTVGAGATGVVYQILSSVRGRVLTATPTFDGYPIVARMAGLPLDTVPLTASGATDLTAMAQAITPQTAAVLVCTPHNPSGVEIDEADLRRFLGQVPQRTIVIVDQAYLEFARRPPDLAALLRDFANVVVVRTFSKAYGLAALRVGYAVGAQRMMGRLREYELPFNVGAAAQCAVPVALSATSQMRRRVQQIGAERSRLVAGLSDMGLRSLESSAPFVFVPTVRAEMLFRGLVENGVLVKHCSGDYPGLRITVGDSLATDAVISALAMCL